MKISLEITIILASISKFELLVKLNEFKTMKRNGIKSNRNGIKLQEIQEMYIAGKQLSVKKVLK